MKIISKIGNDKIATVYIGENNEGKQCEFVESIQPPNTREQKWVLMISTLYGCPAQCRFCDAGGTYQGLVSYDEMMFQIDYLIKSRYPTLSVPVEKFKIQFSRMGEPALNNSVLDVIKDIPKKYALSSYMPSISSIAPAGCDVFFDQLLTIFHEMKQGSFQMQFSIHSTDENYRNWLMPIKKWDFTKIAHFGEKLYRAGDRKITLNFALSKDAEIDSNVLINFFDPEKFLIKITPINPTHSVIKNNISSLISEDNQSSRLFDDLKKHGYDLIVSIGDLEENIIGSNCGQYVIRHLNSNTTIDNGYKYKPN